MATTTVNDAAFVTKAIQGELERYIEKGLDDAAIEFRKRLQSKVGVIALSMMDHYDISRMNDRVVITIRNKTDIGTP